MDRAIVVCGLNGFGYSDNSIDDGTIRDSVLLDIVTDPSKYRRIAPESPTIHPWNLSVKQTEERLIVVGEGTAIHDSPPVVVLRIAPC
jgi:hypothetical protein